MAKQNFSFIPEFRQNFNPNSQEEKTGEVENILNKIENIENNNQIPFNFKFIPRDKIVFNKDNDFKQDDIEKLAESILHFGLLHNLEAIYDEDSDTYILESGERRCRAIDLLIKQFDTEQVELNQKNLDLINLFNKNVAGFKRGYPVSVKRISTTDQMAEIDSRLRLISANLEIRDEDAATKLQHLEHYKKLLEEKNSLLPASAQISIVKQLAKTVNISERQVKKYNAVMTLQPELKELFKDGNITLNESSALSQLPYEEQLEIALLIKEGQKINAKEYSILKAKADKQNSIITEHEKALKEAEEEKAQFEEKLKVALEEQQSKFDIEKVKLKNQIEEEIRKDTPDAEIIKNFQQELQEKENNYKKLIDEERNKAAKNADMLQANILMLKKRLNDTVEETNKKSVELLEMAKQSYKNEVMISLLQKTLKDIENKIASFDENQKTITNKIVTDFLEFLHLHHDGVKN